MPHRLLLADDSVTIQRVIELTFSEEDVQVTAVGNGQQAIDRIREELPDIVLTDVAMPERDGYEVAAFIKGDPALAHIPVVLLTGAYEPVDEARAKAIGCDGVMVKPFEPQMVINRVRELLEGKRPTSLWAASASLDQPDAVGFDTAEGAPAPGAAGPAPAAAGTDASEVSARSSESLDTYLDRLTDALGTLGDQPPTAAAESTELVETSVESMEAAPSPVEFPTLGGPPAAAGVSLAEMFSALLAVEQQWSAPPDTPGGRAAASRATERLVSDITRRVLDQVTDRAVRDTVSRAVSQVAERLVREEIERIKVVADAEEDASQQL